MSRGETLIVGIGSPQGDDSAGWLVADELVGCVEREGVRVRKAKSPADLLDWLEGVERLIVCDACRGLGRPGRIRCWIWPTTELADLHFSGTHDLSLLAVLALARQLGRLPARVVIWAVESANRGAAEPMSDEVQAAAPELVERIRQEVQHESSFQADPCTNDR